MSADKPAFPSYMHPDSFEGKGMGGMTFRQYAAVHAMQGMMSRDTYDPGQSTPEQRAKLAVIETDALLAELEKTK